MYIRESVSTNRKTGAKYTKHLLVQSIQTEKGPRQRVIMHLGTLSLPRTEWPKLARVLEARLAGQTSLFEDNAEISVAAEAAMQHFAFRQMAAEDKGASGQDERCLATVDLNSTETLQSRSLGAELIGHAFWERLNFDVILDECGLDVTERSLAQGAILARLIAPASDRATWKWLRKTSALPEMLPISLEKMGQDRIYEIADRLLGHKDAIEQRLYDRERSLYALGSSIFLYDLTNTYFEGQCLGNELAKRGHSKEKRLDCPLVTLALVVDAQGFCVMSRIYRGNQSEPETLVDILRSLQHQTEPLLADALPTIIMDRGIATHDNMELLKAEHYPYIVVERRSSEKDYVEEFEQAKASFTRLESSEFAPLHKGDATVVHVKKVMTEDACRVLCISEGRMVKERAMDAQKEARFLEDLSRLQSSVRKGSIRLAAKVSERIGRFKERYPSISAHYEITLEPTTDQKKVADLAWSKKTSRAQRSTLEGCYVIETSHKDLDATAIWHLYTTLTRVEDSFRALKTDLGMRPVHHQLAHRTEAHLFISVLAYHILRAVEYQLEQHGDHRSWTTIKQELVTHVRNTVAITDADGSVHHIRVSGRPEQEQRELYTLLNIKDPLKRARRHLA